MGLKVTDQEIDAAEKKYLEAVKKYGKDSIQAKKAEQKLNTLRNWIFGKE